VPQALPPAQAQEPLISSYPYTLGAAGNRLSVAELSGRTVTYGYDDLYRLVSETIAGDVTQNGTVSYQYDSVGNRTKITSTLPAFSSSGLINYDANDRTATDPYDANGNLLVSGAGGNVYDFENRLVAAGARTIAYDGDGNRVSETLASGTTSFLVADQSLTGYAQVMDELQNGAVSRSYTWGLELISQRLTANSQGPNFYGFDGHGSVRFLTDSTGRITDTYDYDAFGNLIASTGTTPNNYLFAGEQFDPALGIYYNRARYYDQRVGRFWTMDTWEGDPQSPSSLHKYLYANANPINNDDPPGYGVLLAALYGQRVHRLIGADFELKTGGVSDVTIKTIIGIGNYLRPDLVNIATGEVYEIKTSGSYGAGVLQLTLYLGILNVFDPLKRRWIPGVSYTPPPVLNLGFATYAFVYPPVLGVITYDVRNLAYDVALISAVSAYALNTAFTTATLTAQFGFA